jgi:DNA polymerase elongation subunit (family B)
MEYTKSKFEKFLFFDIETCGQYPNLQDHVDNTSPVAEEIFSKKSQRLNNGKGWTGDAHADYPNNVALFPEFGRIACLSYGLWKNGEMQIATIIEKDEKTLLKKVANLFHRAGASGLIPTGWNIKNFDVPWIVRRLLINGIPVPQILSTYEKKPWEMGIFDMKDYWKSGSSLDVTFEEACFGMGVPTPKDDIDGSQVHEKFWNGEHSRIATYCEKDVKGMILMAEKIYQVYNPVTIKENLYDA